MSGPHDSELEFAGHRLTGWPATVVLILLIMALVLFGVVVGVLLP